VEVEKTNFSAGTGKTHKVCYSTEPKGGVDDSSAASDKLIFYISKIVQTTNFFNYWFKVFLRTKRT